MSSQARLENVLRDIHVMISKSEVYDTDRIIVSKQDIFNLIDRLNASIYEIMDEYELTQQSRDRAIREKKKEGDKIIWDASRQAEDIYAASVLYTEEALNHLNVMVNEADATVDQMYKEFRRNIKHQQETIRENQLELKSQLQLLADTEKYLRLIEERNREIERERAEKKGRKTLENFGEKHMAIKPEIKINEDYFRKAGIPLEKEEEPVQEEFLEPLEDEGVIESTLKKAAQEMQHLFGETQSEQKKEAVSEQDYDSLGQEASDGTDGADKEMENARTALITEQKEAVDTESCATGDAGHQAAGIQTGSAAGNSSETGGHTADGVKADSQLHLQTDNGKEEDAAAEPEIKVNLDAAYFRQKRDELDETEKQPEHGSRLSLLDKLMGKKKTLL